MENLNALRETLPEAARDVKINLQTVLQPGALSEAQLWGVAVASAYATLILLLSIAATVTYLVALRSKSGEAL